MTGLLSLAPNLDRVAELEFRAQCLGFLGQWPRTVPLLREALLLRPDHPSYPHWLTAVLIQVQDTDGYRAQCRSQLVFHKETTDPLVAERAAKDILILPVADVDFTIVNRLADLALAAPDKRELIGWFQLLKALAEYRQNRQESAADWARKVSVPEESRELHAQAEAVLAMACQKLRQNDNARAALKRAIDLAGETGGKPDEGRFGSNWWDKIAMHALIREARFIVEDGKAPDASVPAKTQRDAL
jgi:hypothetical protein